MALTLNQLNSASLAEAAQMLDGLYEHSPWIAAAALQQRPFRSLAELKHAMVKALEAAGGICAFNTIDLGIATMSAAEVAGRFHIDNRIMYSIGRACLDLEMFGPKVKQALGIPLSVTGKNPFFDRKA